ncbi:HAMP domain-containing protein [Streptomyces sp. T1317-0309]|nr:HAMP domain-containing protein [Streptomyces sp. T1317-0309]
MERDDWRAEPIRDEFYRIVATRQSLVTAREERAVATADRAVAASVGGLTGSVLLLTAFAGYIIRAIVHPVRRTAAMADRLANGDLSARTPETGVSEIGGLERSFNRMAASLQESHAELSTSRSRILAAADRARQRIEHDLHDGAQQQLVAVILELKTVQSAIPAAQPWLKAKAARAADELVGVLDGLRELSHGIHPAVLSKGGLPPALRALARRSPVPVTLDVDVPQRLFEPIEVAAYYVVSEALTNTAKHAQRPTSTSRRGPATTSCTWPFTMTVSEAPHWGTARAWLASPTGYERWAASSPSTAPTGKEAPCGHAFP